MKVIASTGRVVPDPNPNPNEGNCFDREDGAAVELSYAATTNVTHGPACEQSSVTLV